MNVYVAIQRGVNRHLIVGVFSDIENAKESGAEAIVAEDDHYHDVEIVEVELDEKFTGWQKYIPNWWQAAQQSAVRGTCGFDDAVVCTLWWDGYKQKVMVR